MNLYFFLLYIKYNKNIFFLRRFLESNQINQVWKPDKIKSIQHRQSPVSIVLVQWRKPVSHQPQAAAYMTFLPVFLKLLPVKLAHSLLHFPYSNAIKTSHPHILNFSCGDGEIRTHVLHTFKKASTKTIYLYTS